MPVENFSVGLGVTSRYDNISAVVRGKNIPMSGQAFTASLGGVAVNFEIEEVEETVLSDAESSYAISGREQKSEFLYRPVDFYMAMSYNSASQAYSLPSVRAIIGQLGQNVVYDAPDFTPTVSGMGWKTSYTGSAGNYSVKVRIREKNVHSLLEKLFGWSSEFGPKQILWHVRAGVLHIWELQRATGQSLTLTPTMCPRGKLKIKRNRLRKFTETTDTSSTSVTTPTSALNINYKYADVPFSGSITWGNSTLVYSDGLLVSNVTSDTDSDGVVSVRSETCSYTRYLDAYVMSRKVTATPNQIVTTVYEHDVEQEGALLGTGRLVPVLRRETTTSQTIKDESAEDDDEKTVVEYSPRGDGFYGITAIRYTSGEISQIQHSTSRSSPGGAASQYTERQICGYTFTSTLATASFPGYVTAPTRIPIESGELAQEYLDIFHDLHGSMESRITAELVGQAAYNPIQGKLVFRGVEYFATEAQVVLDPKSKRVSVAGVRWDEDANYRINVLGFDD